MTNSTTGLPELPAPLFWRVGRTYDYDTELNLRIVDPSATRVVRRIPAKWYRKASEVTETYEESILISDVSRLLETQGLSKEEALSAKKSLDDGGSGGWRFVRTDESTRDDPRYMLINKTPTPEALKETAERIYKEWAAVREVDNLIGDYPPKSLA